MTFNSFAFLGFFVVVGFVRLLFWRNSNASAYLWILLVAGLVFYGWHEPVYLLILLFTCVVDFVAGLMLAIETRTPFSRRAILCVSLATNLGVLGFFKYYEFIAGNLRYVARAWSVDPSWIPLVAVTLPVGISFYTFQSMSYTIDVYRGELRPTRSFFRFLLFVSFFPQLVAGPIVRAREFLYQFDRSRRLIWPVFLTGGYLVIRGFMLKLVVADNIGPVLGGTEQVTGLWQMASQPGAGSSLAWICAILFSVQIFADFCGYTDIARGLAYWLGYRLPINFNSPYIARSFSDFWRRWHITLSSWLRDYLYVPLGGNRVSVPRTYVNLMIVMFLGGLWHGAAWTFVIWGLIHGMGLAIERALGWARPWEDQRLQALTVVRGVLWFLVVQITVLVAWVFFRSETFADAGTFLANMFAFDFRPLELRGPEALQVAVLATIPVILMHLRQAAWELFRFPRPGPAEQAVLAACMLYLALSFYGRANEFIYFQF